MQIQEGGKPLKIVITLPTNAYFISGVRDFTLGLIKNTSKFSEQWAYRFQSVVDELCNNAIEYGSSAEASIRITFTVDPEKSIQIQVEDTGTGKKPMEAKELSKLVASRRKPDYVFKGIRGRGLAKIVSEWTDELVFSDRPDGGVIVSVTKNLDVPVEEPVSKTPGEITIHSAAPKEV